MDARHVPGAYVAVRVAQVRGECGPAPPARDVQAAAALRGPEVGGDDAGALPGDQAGLGDSRVTSAGGTAAPTGRTPGASSGEVPSGGARTTSPSATPQWRRPACGQVGPHVVPRDTPRQVPPDDRRNP
ncbi:hypothetical protein GCM10010254_41340 [Streptomyces chromofuscus]|nr:hypothetical protein GCM10010254_41340 [Streptomyces chromofuscus]